jgi:CRISPR/Cas system CMR subunit Cmr4 (Cas7 group RAMP superfamily)
MATLDLELIVEMPLRIGDGMSVRRDRAGRPCIPATVVKGCLRSAVESIAGALDWPVCRAPDRNEMCHPFKAEPCVVCQLFGSPWSEGRLYFTDLITDDPPVLATRQHAAWSRARGIALDSAIWHGEALPAGTIFKGTLRHPLTERWQLALVVAGFGAIRRIGEGYAVGWGACRVVVGGIGDRTALADALTVYLDGRDKPSRGRG